MHSKTQCLIFLIFELDDLQNMNHSIKKTVNLKSLCGIIYERIIIKV